VVIPQKKGDPISIRVDEYPRAGTTKEKLAGLKAAFEKDGSVTAGNASGINDGAAALVVARRETAAAVGTARSRASCPMRSAGVDHERRGASLMPDALPAVTDPSFSNAALRPASFSFVVPPADTRRPSNRRDRPFSGNHHRHDLVLEAAIRRGVDGATLALRRKRVLIGPRNVVSLRDGFGGDAIWQSFSRSVNPSATMESMTSPSPCD